MAPAMNKGWKIGRDAFITGIRKPRPTGRFAFCLNGSAIALSY
jgi:hypothetical protein